MAVMTTIITQNLRLLSSDFLRKKTFGRYILKPSSKRTVKLNGVVIESETVNIKWLKNKTGFISSKQWFPIFLYVCGVKTGHFTLGLGKWFLYIVPFREGNSSISRFRIVHWIDFSYIIYEIQTTLRDILKTIFCFQYVRYLTEEFQAGSNSSYCFSIINSNFQGLYLGHSARL